MRINPRRTDRGTSITITHVLTIGITTLLIAALLTSSGTLLENETERSAESSLETIGERLAGEIESVDRMATDDASVTVTADHPRTVANSRYTVKLLDSDECGNADLLSDSPTNTNDCLRLTASNADTEVYVPVAIDNLDDGQPPVSGGSLEISKESGTVTIERAD
ncbi:DUF7266 family protein [Natrinema limicola]|uniref:Uncharacterized protein n=1 Tax=Natrinema limicola JCM 13563 TaxID=1230457 RepID=M0CNH8_9EURY|nr:hypothetical protein [Natrinema limicola]ELZ23947.1 hypothetical protein C476_04340 [Natrinema limicola JCM 13563]